MSSLSSSVRYIHLSDNTLGKGTNPTFLPAATDYKTRDRILKHRVLTILEPCRLIHTSPSQSRQIVMQQPRKTQ